MADKNVKLKSGSDTLYPKTKIGNILNEDGTPFNPTQVTSDTNDVTSTDKATSPKYVKDYVGSKLTPINTALTSKADLQNGKIPSSQLPSYVDDILEYTNKSSFPSSGETGKIYVDKATNKIYRWSGTQYTEISSSVGLGETSSTAYAGNKGKQNADNIATLQTQLGNLQTQVNNLPSPPSLTSDITNTTGTSVATTPKYVADYVAKHASGGGGGSGGTQLYEHNITTTSGDLIIIVSSHSDQIHDLNEPSSAYISIVLLNPGTGAYCTALYSINNDTLESMVSYWDGSKMVDIKDPTIKSDIVTPLGSAGGSSLPDVSTATAGQVLMADGTGGMSWKTLPEYNGEVA